MFADIWNEKATVGPTEVESSVCSLKIGQEAGGPTTAKSADHTTESQSGSGSGKLLWYQTE